MTLVSRWVILTMMGLWVYIGAQLKSNDMMVAGDAHLVLGFLWHHFLKNVSFIPEISCFYPTPYPMGSFGKDSCDCCLLNISMVASHRTSLQETGLLPFQINYDSASWKLDHHYIYCNNWWLSFSLLVVLCKHSICLLKPVAAVKKQTNKKTCFGKS